MLSGIAILIAIFTLYKVIKKPEYGLIASIIIISIGPVFDAYISGSFKFILIFGIFGIELYQVTINKCVKTIAVIYFFVVLFKEISSYLLGASNEYAAFLSLYVYVVLAGIAYMSFQVIRIKNVDFLSHYKLYILISVLIQWYRTIFDYTFFGLAPLQNTEEQYASLFQYGGQFFRPSNLQTPIVFSVELAIFFGMVLFRENITKKSVFWLGISMVGVMLTNSRSGMVILFVEVMAYVIIQKRYKTAIAIAVAGIFAIYAFGYYTRILTIFDFSNHTYLLRFSSITNAMNQIWNFSLKELLFGIGYGNANYIQADNSVVFYVENFYLSLIANSGFPVFIAFLIYTIRTVMRGIRHRDIMTIHLLCLLLVNFVACSMLLYTVQLLFWYMCQSINQCKGDCTYR